MPGMRCRKCGGLAVINMRQHRLALCEEHFVEWMRANTQRFIEKYRMFGPDDRVLVAVSGGKDSLGLWDILLALGYKADGLYLGLGIDGGIDYSDHSRVCAEKFVRDFWPDARLHTLDITGTYGESIPEVARRTHRGRGKPSTPPPGGGRCGGVPRAPGGLPPWLASRRCSLPIGPASHARSSRCA